MKLGYLSIAFSTALLSIGAVNSNQEEFNVEKIELNESISINDNQASPIEIEKIIGNTDDSLSQALATLNGSDMWVDDLNSWLENNSGAYIDTIDDYLYYQNYNQPIETTDDFKRYITCEYNLDSFLQSLGSCYVKVDLNSDNQTTSFLCRLSRINALYHYGILSYGNNYSINSWLRIGTNTIGISGASIDYSEYDLKEYDSNNNYYYYVDIDNPLTFEQIKASVKAIDETDGDISDEIVYTHTYPSDLSQLEVKEYLVRGVSTDSSDNTTEFVFTISVYDETKPSINNLVYQVDNTSSKLTTDDIIEKANITDNYYSKDDLIISCIDMNDYDVHYQCGGNYSFKITATDPSGNVNEDTFVLTVLDKTAPQFKSTDNEQLNLSGGVITTRLSSEVNIDYAYIKGLLKATDETDGDITDKIEVDKLNSTFIGNENKASKDPYTLVFKVSDAANNLQTLTLQIYVQDDIPPVIYFNGNIYVNKTTPVTVNELSNFFLKINNLSGQTYMSTISSNYFGKESTVGKYESTCSVYSLDKKEKVLNFNFDIVVLNEDGSISDKDLAPKKKWYQKIVDFIKKIIKKVFDYIKKLIKKILKLFKKIFK